MHFENNTGGIKVQAQGGFESTIKPIRSPQKRSKIVSCKSEKLELPGKKPAVPREKSSILDKNNLYLVSFLKNKVKRISKLIEKAPQEVDVRDLRHFPSDIDSAAVEYNQRSKAKRASSVISGKKHSRGRSSKGNGLEVVPW